MIKKEGNIRVKWDNVVRDYYVYAHYTADNKKLFYIGIGKYRPGNTIGRKYLRAYSCAKSQRNKLWIHKYNKHGRDVKILFDNLTEKEAKEKEIELISEYGTIFNRNGCLCNISGGGEGRFRDNSMCKKTYVYSLKGELINEFDSCEEAAEFYNLNRSNVGNAALEKVKTCGGYQFRYEENKDHNIQCFNKTPRKVASPIIATNIETGEVKHFDSAYKFMIYNNIKHNSHIWEALHGKRGRKIVKGWEIRYA